MLLKFTPLLKTLIWGSEKWLLSGVRGSESEVAEGPLAGRTLNGVYGGEFPLLIKLIDARDDLSIQVHPGDELAAKRHNSKGKTEMWYITGAQEGARLLAGFSRRISPDEYERLVAEDAIAGALAGHKVGRGDVFYIPSGRVHAICGGCSLVEIQENSDITYRIYDYSRPGLDGKPRELHTELAKEAIDYNVYPSYRTAYKRPRNGGTMLVKDSHFVTSLYSLDRPAALEAPENSRFLALVCTGGAGSADGIRFAEGEALLILDHDTPVEIRPEGQIEFLTTYL